MINYITIDGGTTNTRICLVQGKKVVDTLRYNIGAKNGIDGKDSLIKVLKEGISEILAKNKLVSKDVKSVLASGMITSEFGLVELKHETLPAGVKELHDSMYFTDFPKICDIPFAFVRGVKSDGTDIENTDVMRGEETELMGIFSGEGIYILPGSHSKVVSVSESGVITDFKTMLTGEMIFALSQNTILKGAVDLTQNETDFSFLEKGYLYAKNHGINEALFKVRVLKNFLGADPKAVYSFFLGAVLCDEIEYIISLSQNKVILGGKEQIKLPMAHLIEVFGNKSITVLSDVQVANSTALGIVKIYEN